MPKLKTHSGTKDRVRVSKNGKVRVGHANMKEGVSTAYTILKGRIRSTHLHDNNGHEDSHLWPFQSQGGTIDWSETMRLLHSLPQQYPLP